MAAAAIVFNQLAARLYVIGMGNRTSRRENKKTQDYVHLSGQVQAFLVGQVLTPMTV
jgi:hypothetical protein